MCRRTGHVQPPGCRAFLAEIQRAPGGFLSKGGGLRTCTCPRADAQRGPRYLYSLDSAPAAGAAPSSATAEGPPPGPCVGEAAPGKGPDVDVNDWMRQAVAWTCSLKAPSCACMLRSVESGWRARRRRRRTRKASRTRRARGCLRATRARNARPPLRMGRRDDAALERGRPHSPIGPRSPASLVPRAPSPGCPHSPCPSGPGGPTFPLDGRKPQSRGSCAASSSGCSCCWLRPHRSPRLRLMWSVTS